MNQCGSISIWFENQENTNELKKNWIENLIIKKKNWTETE